MSCGLTTNCPWTACEISRNVLEADWKLLFDFSDGRRSKECSKSRVNDSIVLAGLARSFVSNVEALEADFYKK